MKLSRNRLKQLVQEELLGLSEAEIWQQEPDSSYAETAPGRKEKVGPWKQIAQHISGKGAKKLGWTPDQAGEFAKSKPVGHISSEFTDTQKPSTKGGGSQFIQDVSTSRGDPGAGPVRVSNKEYNIGSQEWKKAAMMKEPEFRATHPGKDYDPRDVVDRSVQQYSTKGGDVQNVQTFGRERTPASALQRQRDVQQYKAAAAADDVAAGIEESTMKLSRNDLKKLIQEEMGLVTEVEGALDTRPVQQDMAVKEILEKIRQLKQEELGQLMQAMQQLGLIPAAQAQ